MLADGAHPCGAARYYRPGALARALAGPPAATAARGLSPGEGFSGIGEHPEHRLAVEARPLLAEVGVRVRGLFDTHRAATLLGWPKVGLADLVSERLGVTLDKAHQQSDFSLRPLPPQMRTYIADDVRYLSELGRLVSAAVALVWVV